VLRCGRSVPVVALHERHDDALAVDALRNGAQDFLVKPEIDRALLLRVVRYACERHRLVSSLQSAALLDTLTGLYNRHGFMTIGQEQLKLAQRQAEYVSLAFVDLDGMKHINDELGHESGDRALIATAGILKSTFRASDLIARLGGDEFIVLALGIQPGATAGVHKRLMRNLAAYNRSQSVPPVGFSVGFASHKPPRKDQTTLEQLMTEADKAMYAVKQTRRACRTFKDQTSTAALNS